MWHLARRLSFNHFRWVAIINKICTSTLTHIRGRKSWEHQLIHITRQKWQLIKRQFLIFMYVAAYDTRVRQITFFSSETLCVWVQFVRAGKKKFNLQLICRKKCTFLEIINFLDVPRAKKNLRNLIKCPSRVQALSLLIAKLPLGNHVAFKHSIITTRMLLKIFRKFPLQHSLLFLHFFHALLIITIAHSFPNDTRDNDSSSYQVECH